MENSPKRIRSEVLARLQNGIRQRENHESLSIDLIDELNSRLVLVNNPTERKSIIKSWYSDIRGVDKLRKHHLNYNKPSFNRELHIVLNDLTIKFRKKFYDYFI